MGYVTAEPIRPQYVNPRHDPAAIRAVLPPGERADFEEDYAAALDEAKATFSLEPVTELLEHWRQRTLLSQSPGHAESLGRVRGMLAGEDLPTVPADLDALLG